MTDLAYCMSSFLMFRTIADHKKNFSREYRHNLKEFENVRVPIGNADELENHLKKSVKEACADGKAALALSGGIDSAILARFMPEGSTAYTFRCLVPGKEVTDEVPQAAKYAGECGLKHQVIEIYWKDFEEYAPVLMKNKGAPLHSIEVQIYKAALSAKADGFTKLIFGENADIIYGGMDGLLAKEWTFGEFVDRYAYLMPYRILKEPEMILAPFQKYEKNGKIDAHEFINEYFRIEALNTYVNACETAGIAFKGPFSTSRLSIPIDYERIRNGDTKYLVREVFRKLYPGWEMPVKTPMPRPMNEWMSDWKGPVRKEFYEHCTENLSGDQKWMVWCLERFMDLIS